MNILLFDHLKEQGNNLWTKALQGVFGHSDVKVLSYPEVVPGEVANVFFIHGTVSDLAEAKKWLDRDEKRYVVLLGSTDTPTYRPLNGANPLKGTRWDFCPWSAREFVAQDKPGIKEFADSVRNGVPNFSRFYSVKPVNLTALFLLAQGYLVVHVLRGQQVELIPERIAEGSHGMSSVNVPLEKVHCNGYWDIFGGVSGENLVEVIAKEWKAMGGGDHLDSEVTNLINIISRKSSVSDVGLVSKAYTVIEKRFEANRGK